MVVVGNIGTWEQLPTVRLMLGKLQILIKQESIMVYTNQRQHDFGHPVLSIDHKEKAGPNFSKLTRHLATSS